MLSQQPNCVHQNQLPVPVLLIQTTQAIRVGDAYALLVEYHFKANNAHDAFALVQQMRQRRIVLHPYLEQDLLEQIHRAVGADLPSDDQVAKHVADDNAVNEEVEEVDSDENNSPVTTTGK